ncbi:WecB/TagA/CpsF family glycosyltransferase [Pseudoalteromonas aurantia]|uniref:Glycosyltransferase n=1 Tax=Pseudoalteromonas aurantia 208 TaxID=1314867 RepID=A0ABR9EE62_9GAMM|nr:WecB/TagA/CpsF family glycosyltransferase [Pseudoalteromonas aurantia]MBE0369281.1 hypothetical protein [Pseudoalteromonas aurantia 208]
MHELLDKIKQSPNIISQLDVSLKARNIEAEVITFVNPYSYLLLRNRVDLVAELDSVYTDAISSAKLFSVFFRKPISRISFDMSSFARAFLEKANENRLKVYFIGSKSDEITKTMAIFKKNYPEIDIVGYEHGYFESDEAVFNRIIQCEAEYVVCGLGTPKQEEFAVKLKRQKSKVKQIYTCGGFLHQTANKLYYYPKFIDQLHLRWLYRVFDDPYVLKRLVIQYPQFFCVVLKDLFTKMK